MQMDDEAVWKNNNNNNFDKTVPYESDPLFVSACVKTEIVMMNHDDAYDPRIVFFG